MSTVSTITKIILLALVSTASGCFMYHEREKVLIPGIDIDQSLRVAELELAENQFSSVLTLWAMRDQVLTADQASKVSALYFKYIDRVASEQQKSGSFSVWHLTWAISNMYRLGSPEVREALDDAYRDAAVRVEQLDRRIARKHFDSEKIYMGDVHWGGRAYAKSHLVVPGNEDYLQSVTEYEP